MAETQVQLAVKFSRICDACPSLESLSSGFPRFSGSQLNAVLAVSRLLSCDPNYSELRPKSIVIEFLRSIQRSFTRTFWPKSFRVGTISTFFVLFLRYVSKAAESSPGLADEIAGFFGNVVISAIRSSDEHRRIVRAFLFALSQTFVPISSSDVDEVVICLIGWFAGPIDVPGSPMDKIAVDFLDFPISEFTPGSPGNEISMVSGPSSGGASRVADDTSIASSRGSMMTNGSSNLWKSNGDQLGLKFGNLGINDGSTSEALPAQQVASFEEESVESLVKQEIAFNLIVHILDKVVDNRLVERVRSIAKKQIQSTSIFLKIRKGDCNEQQSRLKARIKTKLKLSLYPAAVKLFIKSLSSLVSEGESVNILIYEAVAILRDAAEACLLSPWIKLQTFEKLFGSLLPEVAQIAVKRGGQPLLNSLIRRTVCFQDKKVKPEVQCKAIQLLADMTVKVNKSELVDMILPLFIETLEKGDASTPGWLREELLDAVFQMASSGFEKSYHETVCWMIRSYLNKLSSVGCAESKTEAHEATTELDEALPRGFRQIASHLTCPKLRSDYRQQLLSMCSDVGLAVGAKNRGCSSCCADAWRGADFLGQLLPAVAEICSDFDPTSNVEPSLLNLFGNLWYYVALFGLVYPIQKMQLSTESVSSAQKSMGYSYQKIFAVQRIAQRTPPLVVSSAKWLEDELELNALHNRGCYNGCSKEKAAVAQRAALSAALGGQVDTAALTQISGVKATYLLAIAILENIRFSSNGGILSGGTTTSASRSAFTCLFEYLKTPNPMHAFFKCLTAVVDSTFETTMSWLGDRMSHTGLEAEARDSTITVHTCFLIKSLSQREERIRDIAVNFLTQLRHKFPQVLWESSCLDSLLFSFDNGSSAVINDPPCTDTVHSLKKKIFREWIIDSLSRAPCTCVGLLQDMLCKEITQPRAKPATDVLNRQPRAKLATDVLSLFQEQSQEKNNCWTGIKTANIPAVMVAAAAASGGSLKLSEAFNLEFLDALMLSVNDRCYYAGAIAGMDSIGGFQSGNKMLLDKFVDLLKEFVNISREGREVDESQFHKTCCQATALVLSILGRGSKSNVESFSQLLDLLCWCPAFISTPSAMETGIFIWTWLVSAAPQLRPHVLSELVDAWLWTIEAKRGLFASEPRYSGPAAKLRPHFYPGEPELLPEIDHVEQIIVHQQWLGFLFDCFEVVRHQSVEQLLLLGRLLQGTTKHPWNFSRHPAATGAFFSLMLLGLKFCSCLCQGNMQKFQTRFQLLEDQIYWASLGWFAHMPEWYDTKYVNFAENEAQSVSLFVHYLSKERGDAIQYGSEGDGRENGNISVDANDLCHPVWGQMENYAVGREKRRQLLIMLCQHEADRLEVWAQPTNRKGNSSWPRISTEKWIEFARTAFSVDPCIALSFASRFPTKAASFKAEVAQLVQAHIQDLQNLPEALPYFVTPKAVEENSVLLQQLPHWAACSITQALEFITPLYKGHRSIMAYVLRVLESYPPERVTFFMPQLVQSLRHDDGKLVEEYLLKAAQGNDIFAHILIWHLQGETVPEPGNNTHVVKNNSFQARLLAVRQRIIDGFSPKEFDIFNRVFSFFDQVTSISSKLFPLPMGERQAGIRRELKKIKLQGEDLYVPTAPSKLLRGIQVDSGIPLQSAAKVPIMITFDVVDRDGDKNDIKPQACIFKVGDDLRQDVLALQVIALLRAIFGAVGIDLYLFPYGVLPTGPKRGIIEVVPNARSRSQMRKKTHVDLYKIFQQEYGPVDSPGFEAARRNFINSCAGYAVASLLLQLKDRHSGNLLYDNVGRLVHIDFGFILGTSPSKVCFERAHFRLSHGMTRLLDPSGDKKSETWNQFLSLCVKGYLVARRHMDAIIAAVLLMQDSGLPCFRRDDLIDDLRRRFHPEMSERDAANFMICACEDAYNNLTMFTYECMQRLHSTCSKKLRKEN